MKNIMFICNGDKSKIKNKEDLCLDGMYVPCVKALDNKYNVFAGMNSNIDEVYDKDNIHFFNQNVYRSLFAIKDNLKAYKTINKIIKKYNIDVIHCNTPIGGLLGRICGHKNHIKKVIYTAHGFHFFKGNSAIKNFIFKNVEKFLAHYTDAIITMNQEDYEAAQKFKLRNNGKIYFIHGVGINTSDFSNIDVNINAKRKELGLKKDDTVLICVGDINSNKNITLLLDIIKYMNNSKIKCLICGKGILMDKMIKKSEQLNISKQVKFLGFRDDIKDLLKISNIYISTSKREGLPRALMEAMASGLLCVVSNVRGNKDLIDNGKGGFCCNNIDEYVNAINNIIKSNSNDIKYSEYNINKIKNYDINNVIKEMKAIYKDIGL